MEIAVNTIDEARHLVASGKYLQAFYTYVLALDKCPWEKKYIEFEFRVLLIKLMHLLFTSPRNIFHMMYCLRLAVRIYPGNVRMLTNIGDVFFKNKRYFEALCHYEKAKYIDSSLISLEIRINGAKKHIFDRRLFRLYNDVIRNVAYTIAIYSEIKPHVDHVLDLDGGIGLSALAAHACLAPSTLGFNSSPALTRLIQNIVLERRDWTILQTHQPIKGFVSSTIQGERNFVIINNFDEALFTDGMLGNLKYAWKNLLCRHPRVLPYRAEYFVAGANCNRISNKYELSKTMRNLLNIPHSMVFCKLPRNKTFYSEDVEKYEDFKILTDELFLFSINFDRYDEVVAMNERSYHDANFVIMEDGEINVIVGWFILYLSRNTVITNDPTVHDISRTFEKRVRGWPQAVFPNFVSREVKMYRRTQAKFMLNEGKLSLVPPFSEDALTISLSVIRFLNDTDFVEAIISCIPAACLYLQQTVDISETDVIDYSPFPIFGLQMMLRGARSLVCYATNEEDKTFIETVFNANNIPLEKITVLLGQYWNREFYKHKVYHAIFCIELHLRGDIDSHKWQAVELLRSCHLAAGGLLLPTTINVIIQLASSDWLDRNNKLSDKNLNGFNVASHVNKYRATQVHNLDLTMLEYEPLSEPVLITNCYNLTRSSIVSVMPLKDGECSAILCWYQLRMFEQDEDITTNRTGSFMDSFAYLPNPPVQICKGDNVNLLRVVDSTGLSKVIIDTEY
ncbi:unnamed protein product [Chilo suppressalis]|uniref:Uncharacterized protein n=1 Tax=Chilo suppressalis TaxID=168631 RepID=A0ABN8BA45_CHISP|nr:unnamed protein product [Chilo suppressalis]